MQHLFGVALILLHNLIYKRKSIGIATKLKKAVFYRWKMTLGWFLKQKVLLSVVVVGTFCFPVGTAHSATSTSHELARNGNTACTVLPQWSRDDCQLQYYVCRISYMLYGSYMQKQIDVAFVTTIKKKCFRISFSIRIFFSSHSYKRVYLD